MSGFLLFSPPFTAYNQKELAERIREGKFRRIPYRYSEELNTLLSKMLNLKVRNELFSNSIMLFKIDVHFLVQCAIIDPLCHQDYLRPSVESILQSSLLADAVAEEQGKAQVRLRRRSADSDCPFQKPTEPTATSAAELRLREQALRDRERVLKEREERLERECRATQTVLDSAIVADLQLNLNKRNHCFYLA